jgi:primosomal protein N' (replication factor Y)
VRVLPDVPAIDKHFDYLVPDELGDQVRVGTVVRIALQGRRVGAWVVADGVEPPPGVALKPIAKVTGWGPPPDVLDLADWAAHRWAGRPAHLLRTATAERAIRALPTPQPAGRGSVPDALDDLARAAFDSPEPTVLRLPPAADVYPAVLAAAACGPALVVAPTARVAQHLGLRLRRAGVPVAILPRDWAVARAGGVTTIGARAAAWAPMPVIAAAVVIDEHDESHQGEQAPTWNARDVVVERARRAGVPCVLVSPCPSLEARAIGRMLAPSRSAERDGWPAIEIVDRRRDDAARTGLFSPAFVAAARRALAEGGDARVVCVLNRTGRSRLLACRACGEIAGCETCGSAVAQPEGAELVCHRCGARRPVLCSACGSIAFKNLRMGVSRAREELEALLDTRVVEVTGAGAADGPPDPAPVYVGTEAVLHQVGPAPLVAFLDIDQELLAPRYRAGEEAMALLVRAGRLVGGRRGGGRVLAQTRLPRHEVLVAALHADPDRLADAERARREELRWPPSVAMAEVSGPAAPVAIESLEGRLGIDVRGPLDGVYLVRAPDHDALADALASIERPPPSAGRLRIAVDPLRR